MTDYRSIPAELKAVKNWVCYRLQPRENGDMGKIPVDPKTLRDAKADKPATWASFEEAVAAYQANPGRLAGIGFEFGNSPFFGIDMDHVIEGGRIAPEAQAIIDTFGSYTEVSPSGRGVHIICRGSYPDGWKKKKGAIGGGDLEMYQTGRYFTITAQPFGTVRGIAERSQEAAKLQNQYKDTKEPKKPAEGRQEPQRGTEGSGDILSKMFNSRAGAEIRALWNGDTRGDHSKADLALVNHLCYWTNGDPVAIDTLFRASGLMREKWDRPESTFGTYGNRTIQTALANFRPYTRPAHQVAGSKTDYAAMEPAAAPASPPVVSEPPKDPTAGLISAADYLRGAFAGDRDRFKGYKQRKTGFADIDNSTGGLYPGLYVLGALSSLGKTTFAHQMADQLAAAGDTVLFFSLEQSVFELTTKSLARESYKLARERKQSEDALSAIEIRGGKSSGLMRDAYKNYLSYADRVIVKECNFGDTAESIADTVAGFIEKTGIVPVVMVDYLQIIPAADARMGDKEKTDQNMRRLKIMQRDHDLVVFVISALNRANYAAQISFESFRESSGIEYTADVVWGMQYGIISRDNAFLSDNKQGDKRRKLQEAKAQTPREIELVCLKNRYGRDFTALFNYYPKHDYFEPGIYLPAAEPKAADLFSGL